MSFGTFNNAQRLQQASQAAFFQNQAAVNAGRFPTPQIINIPAPYGQLAGPPVILGGQQQPNVGMMMSYFTQMMTAMAQLGGGFADYAGGQQPQQYGQQQPQGYGGAKPTGGSYGGGGGGGYAAPKPAYTPAPVHKPAPAPPAKKGGYH